MLLNDTINRFDSLKDEAFEWLRHELTTLRSGRVKPDIVESIPVEHYGARTPLNGLASISSSDARTLLVSPWDKTAIVAIEKAISNAQLGVHPVVDGSVIRLAFPSLTEEVRMQTLKTLNAKAEETRVRLRQGRDEVLRAVKVAKEKGDVSEDDFYDAKRELDERISIANKEIESIVEKKEEEITSI